MRQPVRARVWFLLVVAGVLAAAFVLTGGLASELRKDERLNWRATRHFEGAVLPSLAQLRNCPAPSGPLPYYAWAQIERLTGDGLIAGRIINAFLTLALAALIAGAGGAALRGILAAAGLMLCPYVVGVGVHLYTDPPALFFLAIGLAAWTRGWHIAGGVAMALAIACRQFAVAVPAAIAAFELWRWGCALRRGQRRSALAWLAPACACFTLLGWIAIWGGLAPPHAVERYDVWTAAAWRLVPRNGLYALTCVGAYFVAVEAALFRRVALLADIRSPWTAAGALVLAGLFALFPPLGNTEYNIASMGYLDRAARATLPDAARMVAYWALAVLVVARFRRHPLPALLVLVQVLVMCKAQVGWDKYNLPVLVALWFVKARGCLDDGTP